MRLKKIRNHVAFVLDQSASMGYIKSSVIDAFNSLITDIDESSRKRGQETSVSLFTFSDHVNTIFFNSPASALGKLTSAEYRPDGWTALFDGIGTAIEALEKSPGADDTSFVLIVLTDGEENRSRAFNERGIQRLIEKVQNTDRWSFAIQLPPGATSSFRRRFPSICNDSIREWELTDSGVRETEVKTSAGLHSYFAARSLGQTQIASFYVQPNMANVSPKTIARKLEDRSDQFKLHEVRNEQIIKDFVERRTRKPYVIGQGYYQLMKSEKVQPRKSVLIMEKGKGAVWGGSEARELIGLPKSADAKVVPGNHANYDIFVQSTSVNRKLPRGTKVLIDTHLSRDLKPTWDHTAVATEAKILKLN